jgi:acyl carrier protein
MAGERSADVRPLVRAELTHRLRRAATEPLATFTDHDSLAQLGVGSLDLLELADALETSLGVSPFDRGVSLTEMRTVGDLYRAYQAAVDGRESDTDEELLRSSRTRAEARRRPRAL